VLEGRITPGPCSIVSPTWVQLHALPSCPHTLRSAIGIRLRVKRRLPGTGMLVCHSRNPGITVTGHEQGENRMYIGGGVITLIIIVVLLVWLF
jgi:hypothetical protein